MASLPIVAAGEHRQAGRYDERQVAPMRQELVRLGFVETRTVEEVDVFINRESRKMPVKCGWMHGRIYVLKAEFGPAETWARELGLPVRDVIRAIEDAGRNLSSKSLSGPGDP